MDPDRNLPTVLAVDDREANLLALDATLRDLPCVLVKASSGAEALAYLEKHEAALVLLDIQMPIMDGFETATRIRLLPMQFPVPIIFLTAIDQRPEHLERAYTLGGADFLYKPFQPWVLRAKVSVFLELYKAREASAHEAASIAQREKRQIEEKYRDLVESVDHAILWSADPQDLKFTFVSPRTQYITGYSLEEWMNTPNFFFNCVPKEDHARLRQLIENAVENGDSGIEHRFRHRDGRILWLHTGIRRALRGDGAGWEVRGLSTDVTPLMEAEAKAKASEQDFRALADSMPQMVFVSDGSGNILHLNQRWYDYTGNLPGDISGDSWRRVIHPDDLGRVYETWQSARPNSRAWSCEFRVLRRDLEYRWHLGRSVPEKDGTGAVRRWTGTVTDIEDRKRIEYALREAKETLELRVQQRTRELSDAHSFLDSVIENIPNMIFVKDAQDLKFVRFNRAGEKLLGLKKEDLLGKTDFDLFPHDQAVHFQSKDRATLAGHQILHIPEEVIQTATNGQRTLSTKKIPVFNSNGTPQYLLGISEDITDRQKLEQERQKFFQAEVERTEAAKASQRLNFLSEASVVLGSSLNFETTLENLTKLAVPTIADWCSIQLVGPDGAIKQLAVTHSNPEKVQWARELYEKYPINLEATYGTAQVIRTGKSELATTITPDLIEKVAKDAEHSELLRGLGFRSYICAAIRAHGQILGALTLVTTDESGRRFVESDLRLAEELGSRAGISVENARLYQEAQNLNRVKDEFLATLSHELRTPLNVIQGNAELLISKDFDLTEAEEAASLEAIYRNAKAQTAMIGDLLDVSSIITGKVSFKPTSIDPAATVVEIIEGLKPTAAAKGVKLVTDFTSAPAHVMADVTRMHQIVWNLVSNALKFTPGDGVVHIKVCDRGSSWAIDVQDTGRGIDREFLPYVFDRFRQEDGSNTRRYGGLGLGLAVVRHLVELHGGTVEADSKGKGHGAKFIATFPYLKENPRASAGQKLAAPESSLQNTASVRLSNIKVLLLEDSDDNRMLIQLILKGAGAEVVEAASAAEAREKLRTFSPDVIVSDIGLPDESGLEFMRKLRRESSEKFVPAVALSAYVREVEIADALSAGFQAHVAKPLNPAKLLETVAQVLRKAQVRELQ
jgi:PAS domain S-box-containing protein